MLSISIRCDPNTPAINGKLVASANLACKSEIVELVIVVVDVVVVVVVVVVGSIDVVEGIIDSVAIISVVVVAVVVEAATATSDIVDVGVSVVVLIVVVVVGVGVVTVVNVDVVLVRVLGADVIVLGVVDVGACVGLIVPLTQTLDSVTHRVLHQPFATQLPLDPRQFSRQQTHQFVDPGAPKLTLQAAQLNTVD
jgi:hypothetical protein